MFLRTQYVMLNVNSVYHTTNLKHIANHKHLLQNLNQSDKTLLENKLLVHKTPQA